MSSKQNDRHIIWSDIHLDFEDWRADLEEQYPDLSEDELIQKMYEINSDYLGDERMNLTLTAHLGCGGHRALGRSL